MNFEFDPVGCVQRLDPDFLADIIQAGSRQEVSLRAMAFDTVLRGCRIEGQVFLMRRLSGCRDK